MPATVLDRLAVNTIKGLTMDAVQAASSGHPGMPMGTADLAYVLWSRFLVHDPDRPDWPDRDRFVLSAGHGSMLLYSLLHLSGYPLSLEDIRQFRQWGSKTPGHPEYGHTVGVETTTGPLGQGFANGVGMALAERYLRERFGPALVDHYTYGIVSDGDLMEGVASEAASLAAHLGLGKLIYLYDDNEITIDGSTSVAFTEDRCARFAAYGWHVLAVDGHDHDSIAQAIDLARKNDDRPSLIACRTHIGHSSPNKQDTAASHGAPLGDEEIRLTKIGLDMDPSATFEVPAEVPLHFQRTREANHSSRIAWEIRMDDSKRKEEWNRWHAAPAVEDVDWPRWTPLDKPLATRKANQAVITEVARVVPQLLGGSADLSGSNGCVLKDHGPISGTDFGGRNLHFGVREHGMGGICNGMALHGGMLPYCATFLVFHDYMRPSVRLAAMMGQQVLYIYSHDSIFLGEDGPTHQPVEHLMAMRLIPGLVTLRPADANEVAAAWRVALARTDGPTAVVTSRQGLPHLPGTSDKAVAGVAQGAYVLAEPDGELQVVLSATGSEVDPALQSQQALAADGIGARVVSMPSWELFAAQDRDTRSRVLPEGVARVSIEAGRTLGWERWVGDNGACVGVDRFGASAPGNVVGEQLGFSVDNVVAVARSVLS